MKTLLVSLLAAGMAASAAGADDPLSDDLAALPASLHTRWFLLEIRAVRSTAWTPATGRTIPNLEERRLTLDTLPVEVGGKPAVRITNAPATLEVLQVRHAAGRIGDFQGPWGELEPAAGSRYLLTCQSTNRSGGNLTNLLQREAVDVSDLADPAVQQRFGALLPRPATPQTKP